MNEYASGRTPNPCVACNTFIKWGELLNYADKLECDYIATGHYARIINDLGKFRLAKASYNEKDQSYALWGISRDALSRTILPIGGISKSEVRKIAAQNEFRNAERPESQEICFIPDNDYAGALKKWSAGESDSFKSGPVYSSSGERLGEHKGVANFTIGQRRGLGISSEAPLYVLKINRDDNSVVVGRKEELLASKFTVSFVNVLVDEKNIAENLAVKIRYKHEGSPASVDFMGDGMTVTFDSPQRAITPGQSAVFYSGEYVVGGGIIENIIG